MTDSESNPTEAAATTADVPVDVAPPSPPPTGHAAARHFEDLPPYSRSLLRIKVPVAVTLARKKQPISKVVEIGPGTILQFNKSCEQLLELEVNGHEIGAGEAVKVGDKFGLRVVAMKLPGEKFHNVAPRRAS
jgi:flagellar motor switch/type III secretory pathway protein FliN